MIPWRSRWLDWEPLRGETISLRRTDKTDKSPSVSSVSGPPRAPVPPKKVRPPAYVELATSSPLVELAICGLDRAVEADPTFLETLRHADDELARLEGEGRDDGPAYRAALERFRGLLEWAAREAGQREAQ